MRVRFDLKNMDDLKVKHLMANLEYWKYDVLLEGRKSIKRLEKSRSIKVFSKVSAPVNNAVMMLEARKDLNEENLKQLIDYKISQDNGFVMLEIFLSDQYFMTVDLLKTQAGKHLSRLMKVFDRQEFVDRFKEEIRSVYTKHFNLVVLESDGKQIKT